MKSFMHLPIFFRPAGAAGPSFDHRPIFGKALVVNSGRAKHRTFATGGAFTVILRRHALRFNQFINFCLQRTDSAWQFFHCLPDRHLVKEV